MTWYSCMACKSAAWVFGRRAVDLVGQDDVGEDRALDEPERPFPGRVVLLDDLGAGDVAGHEVGSELDAAELQVQGPGEGGHGQGLGQPGHADGQAVAAGEEADQHLLEHLLLADDHLVDLAAEQLASPLHALHGFLGTGLGGGRSAMASTCRGLLIMDTVAEDSLVSGALAWSALADNEPTARKSYPVAPRSVTLIVPILSDFLDIREVAGRGSAKCNRIPPQVRLMRFRP